jgi:membrane-bound lytic murein transglycosylase D
LEYLRDLYAFFDGDWSLAVSAYNMGEGGLDRAIASVGGERDIWKLYVTPPASDRIKEETKEYYPKFLATLIVANNPERYGFRLNPIAPEDTVRVPVDGSYALAELNRALDLGSGTLESLNPDLIRQATPASGSYAVAIPSDKREILMAALPTLKKGGSVQMASAPAEAGGVHTVGRGETLSRIASRYGVSTSNLMKANNLRSANYIHSGQKLKIPGGSAPVEPANTEKATGGAPGNTTPAATPTVAPAPVSEPSPVAVAAARTYKVRTGDTLYEIARKHDVTVGELQDWNAMGRSSRLLVGKAVYVQDPDKPAASIGDGQYHEVRAGEYPARIAKAHGMQLEQLLALNNLTADDTIRVGDKLVVAKGNPAAVYADKKSTETAEPKASEPKATHTVARGDTASTIAQRYGVKTQELLAWNNLGGRSVLQVGDKLVVYSGMGSGPAPGSASPDDDGLDKLIHTVARGHNPTTIARRYGVPVSDLFRWNNWPKDKVLKVGDEVIVFKAR